MRTVIRVVDTFAVGLARHWLLWANLFLLIFTGLPFLAPVLMHAGLEFPARVIYSAYSFTCHQLSYRTWFLFGAQPSYSVAQLQQYLGVNNSALDILYWRVFLGNAQVGYKMAWCERDVAMYTSMLLTGLVFATVRGRIKPLNVKLYLLFAILPMLLDGGTQLLMLRESTPLLRTVTGTLFGVLSVWLIYPYVEVAMRDTYAQSMNQLQKLSRRAVSPGVD